MERARKSPRFFTPEQKLAILQTIQADIKNGTAALNAIAKQGIAVSQFYKWKRQLDVGVRSSLRNGKPPIDKEKKRLEREIEKLKNIVLSQSQMIADLKKETNWD